MADPVRSLHLREVEALRHILGKADFLVDFQRIADAHDLDVGAQMRQRAAGGVGLVGGQFEHRMRALDLHRDRLADRLFQILVEFGEIPCGIGGLHRDLRQAIPRAAIDRDSRAVRPAIGHGHQHVRQHRAELGFK